ncbi:MAG TPA: ferrochelatase [Actinomycetota bacterium]|nr:ferrochelatase [Actinomycetota bacterium]
MARLVKGVLVMAYGTPRGLDDVERYYTDIRHGRPPSPDLLRELTARYEAIGGKSPLYEITEAQRIGLEQRLDGVRTYLGQKHSPPSIPAAVRAMAADGVESVVGLVLAPHYSNMSIGDYRRRVARSMKDTGWEVPLTVVESWHLEPGYVRFLARRVEDALAELSAHAREQSVVVFTAHSLPEKILASGDPYAAQLRETADAVAELAGLGSYTIGWQSAGRTADPWIGPDVLDVLQRVAGDGARGVVVCPCGFVSDHLEVLYDVDVECVQKAADLGIELVRTQSPNDDPEFLDVLTTVVGRELGRAPVEA